MVTQRLVVQSAMLAYLLEILNQFKIRITNAKSLYYIQKNSVFEVWTISLTFLASVNAIILIEHLLVALRFRT